MTTCVRMEVSVRRLADFGAKKAAKKEKVDESFSWIFGRKVTI